MLKFGFIGIGQVGGFFSSLAKEKGHTALAINTANVDLNSLTDLEKSEKVHLIGYGGAGKDREVGKESFLSHKDMLLDAIKEKFEECQVLFPIFALGGGTGSGMGPVMTQYLTELFPDKVISPILFFPQRDESPRAKMNALESFSEISNIEDIGATFIIDNQKVMDLHQSYTLKEKHDTARKEFLALLDYFNRKTEEESIVSNLDEMDILTTLSERGCACVTEMSIDENDAKDAAKLGERLVKSIEFSMFAKTNISGVSKVAIIAEIQPKLTTHLKLESMFQTIGIPLEIFTGIYEEEKQSKLYVFLTGLPFPTTVLKEIQEDIRKNEEKIIKSLDTTRNQTFDIKSPWTQKLKRNRKIKV